MTLSEYLQAENMKASHLAERLEVPASTISRILNGQRRPSFGLMRKIAEVTGGKVTPNDFVAVALPDEASDDDSAPIPPSRPRYAPKPDAEAGSAETGEDEIEIGDAA